MRRRGARRVLPSPPRDLHVPDVAALAGEQEEYLVAVPLEASIRAGLLEPVQHVTVPSGVECPPPTRSKGSILPDGSVQWWLVRDRNGERRVEVLEPHERRYSPGGIWTVPLLAKRIARGWKPEDALGAPSHMPFEPADDGGDEEGTACHYLYFPSVAAAQRAAADVRKQGYQAELGDQGRYGWLVKVKSLEISHSLDDDMDWLESLAESVGGEYDGYEIDVESL